LILQKENYIKKALEDIGTGNDFLNFSKIRAENER
jgi:hypothetical protein